MKNYIVCIVALLITFHSSSAVSESNESKVVLYWSDGNLESYAPEMLVERFATIKYTQIKRASSNITWHISYEDETNSTGEGFDDPAYGAARKAVLESVLFEIGETLRPHNNSTLELIVHASLNSNDNLLARAGSYLGPSGNGIVNGYTAKHIQSGTDPDGSAPDLSVQVNFFHNFHLNNNQTALNKYDFRSVMLHEIGHALGMVSFIGANGKSTVSMSNPGVFSSFDALIIDLGRNKVVNSSGQFLGNLDGLTGVNGNALSWFDNAVAAELGHDPRLYTPDPYEAGSSISHWELSESSASMKPSLAKGQQQRKFAKFEVSMFKALGYSNAKVTTPQLYSFLPAKKFASAEAISSIQVQALTKVADTQEFVILENGRNGSVLRIYPKLNPASSLSYDLPEQKYWRMSRGEVGPKFDNGLILTSANQNSVLSLAAPDFSLIGHVMQSSDFEFIHRVDGPNSSSNIYWFNDPTVSLFGEHNQTSVLAVSPNGGLQVFKNDDRGHFDGPRNSKQLSILNQTSHPFRGVTAFDQDGDEKVSVSFGINRLRDILTYDLRSSNKRVHTQSNSPFGNVLALIRLGVTGYASMTADFKNEFFAKLSFKTDGTYSVKKTWPLSSKLTGLVRLDHPTRIIISQAETHSISSLNFSGNNFVRVAGGKQGYRDGSLADAQFNRPTSLCAQGNNVYVVDAGNALIRKIDLLNKVVSTLAGKKGIHQSVNDGPRGVGTFDFRSFYLGNQSCTIIGDSLFVLNSYDITSWVSISKVNLNTGFISTVSKGFGPIWTTNISDITSSNGNLYVTQAGDKRLIKSAEMLPKKGTKVSATIIRGVDMNADGTMEIIALLYDHLLTVEYYRNLGNDKFRVQSRLSLETPALNVFVTDADLDGFEDDLIIVSRDSIKTYLNDDTGKFVEDPKRKIRLNTGIVWAQVEDIDYDHNKDLVILDKNGELRVFLFENGSWTNGSGNFGEHSSVNLKIRGARWFEFKDFNYDGYPDIAVIGPQNARFASYFEGISN